MYLLEMYISVNNMCKYMAELHNYLFLILLASLCKLKHLMKLCVINSSKILSALLKMLLLFSANDVCSFLRIEKLEGSTLTCVFFPYFQ